MTKVANVLLQELFNNMTVSDVVTWFPTLFL